MSAIDLTDSSISSNSTTTTEDITEPSSDPFNSIDLQDYKEYLEARYGEAEEKTRKRRLKRKLIEFIENEEVPYNDKSTEEYPVKNTDKRNGWDLSIDNLEEIELDTLQLKNIIKDKEDNQWDCHRCYQEDNLFVALGIKYALTNNLPVGWTPTLLIEVILEACVYHAFSNRGNLSIFARDAWLLQQKVQPETEFFAGTEFYFRHAVYNLKYIPRIGRIGPYGHKPEEVSIAHRHRPWNEYFRTQLSTVIVRGRIERRKRERVSAVLGGSVVEV